MAKQIRGLRGPRGLPGPAGPPGPAGATGKTGATGQRGTSAKADSAWQLTRDDRVEILSLVEGQIEDIYKALDLQMKRMVQFQAQIDDVRSKVRELIANLK